MRCGAPGKHYFINCSAEVVGVVEAQLLPGRTYDLQVRTAGAFIASFNLIKARLAQQREVGSFVLTRNDCKLLGSS